jgi:hypothetical protein
MALERPIGTTQQYSRRVLLWLNFNRTGYRGRPYDPLRASVAKFRLFAGWLFARSVDKDLNAWRSAINRFLEDHGAARQLLGHSVSTVIRKYKQLQIMRKLARGEEPELHRVPCPEIAIRRLVDIGRSCGRRDLVWVCALLLMLLCWFRAATVAGLQPGDVRFDADGNLNVSARSVKGRPEFKQRPALIQIRRATEKGHPRRSIFKVLHRLLDREPDALCVVGESVSASARGGATAANKLTTEFRRLVPPETLNLPAGAIVASHSFRELGATMSIKARYSPSLSADHGLWKRIATMHEHYYFAEFPWSAWLAAVFDFLQTR